MLSDDAYTPCHSVPAAEATGILDQDPQAELAEALAWTGTEELVGVLAHGLGNALGVILNNARFVVDGIPAGSAAAQDARQIVKGAAEAVVLVRQLGLLGCSPRRDVYAVGVGTLARDLEPVLRRGFGTRAHLRVEIDDDVPDVRIDPTALARAMLTIVLARRDELEEGATLELHVRANAAHDGAIILMQGPAVAFDPIRAGGRGLAAAAGARLEAAPAPAGSAALSLAVPNNDV